MPRVRSHTRRDGSRVRGHYRRPRRTGVARWVSKPRRTRRGSSYKTWPILAVVLVGLLIVVQFVKQHPYWFAFLAILATGAAVAVLTHISKVRARERADQAVRDRLIAHTDVMTGSQFEQWFARLLVASGFTGVKVCGGAGDRGADVIATAPDGRRVVAQCKRYSANNRVGSEAIQRFAGTCRAIHHGEICLIVTNSTFSSGDGRRLAQQLGIALVDRRLLEVWAHTRTPPASILG